MQDKDVAEDLAQDSFFVLWEKRDEIQISVKSYLYRIAINKSFNHLQKSKKFVETKDGDLTEFESSENTTENQVNLVYAENEVKQAIDSLPPACRAIFVMSRMDEMSYKEISESLEISIKTVENQMSKALRILREKLLMILVIFFAFYSNYL